MNGTQTDLSADERWRLQQSGPHPLVPPRIETTIEGRRLASEVWPCAYLYALRLNQVDAEGIRWASVRATGAQWSRSKVSASAWVEGRLCDVLFQDVHFDEATLANCHFERCTFDRCRFENSRFLDCTFDACVFTACRLLSTELTDSTIRNTVFKGCCLFTIRVTGNLAGVGFVGGSLSSVQFTTINGTGVNVRDATLEQVSILGGTLGALRFESCRGNELTLYDLTTEHLVIHACGEMMGLGVVGGAITTFDLSRTLLCSANIGEIRIGILRGRDIEFRHCALERTTIRESCTIMNSRSTGLVLAQNTINALSLPQTVLSGYLDIRTSRFSGLNLDAILPEHNLDLIVENVSYASSTSGDGSAKSDRWEQLHGP